MALLCDGLLCQFTHNWTFTRFTICLRRGRRWHSFMRRRSWAVCCCDSFPKAASFTSRFFFVVVVFFVTQLFAAETNRCTRARARLLSSWRLCWIFGLKTQRQCCCFNRLVSHRKLGRRRASPMEPRCALTKPLLKCKELLRQPSNTCIFWGVLWLTKRKGTIWLVHCLLNYKCSNFQHLIFWFFHFFFLNSASKEDIVWFESTNSRVFPSHPPKMSWN